MTPRFRRTSQLGIGQLGALFLVHYTPTPNATGMAARRTSLCGVKCALAAPYIGEVCGERFGACSSALENVNCDECRARAAAARAA